MMNSFCTLKTLCCPGVLQLEFFFICIERDALEPLESNVSPNAIRYPAHCAAQFVLLIRKFEFSI